MGRDDASYGAKDITVLEGLEPVRMRPGMYIGSTGPTGLHHLVWEVVDNSVDEAMAGYCTRIDVTLLADGGCRVVDDGRGIPVDPHPQYPDRSAAEIVLTTLHAGGKFGGAGYKVSGGLHGVGVSVVNALSTRLVLEIDREGQHHVLEFADGGRAQGQAEGDRAPRRGAAPAPPSPSGPTPSIFEEVEFRAQTIIERLQVMAFLNKGLEIRFADERAGREARRRCSSTTAASSTTSSTSTRPRSRCSARSPPTSRPRTHQEVEVALQWNTGFHESHPLLRQRDLHHRGRDARGGLQEGPDQRGQPLRPRRATC